MEISSSEDEPAAMGYESTRQGRSAVAGQRRQDRAAVAAGQSSRSGAEQRRQGSGGGKTGQGCDEGRATVGGLGGVVGVGGSQGSRQADRRRRRWRIAGQRQIAGQSLDLSLLPFFGLL